MATATQARTSGVEILADIPRDAAHILSRPALEFLAALERRTRARRRDLLVTRKLRQARLDGGELPDFLEETADIRESPWRVSPAPDDLQDRRVEITGPVDR